MSRAKPPRSFCSTMIFRLSSTASDKRRISDNLAKATTYILAVHVPIAGVSLLPVVVKWPLILLPIHIAFLHLIIDPACSVVFEAEPAADDVMTRPPRDPREPLFGQRTAVFSLVQGLVTFGVLAGLYSIVLRSGQGELEARALTFTALIIANLGLILANRSWSRTTLNMYECRIPRCGGLRAARSYFLRLLCQSLRFAACSDSRQFTWTI